MDDANIISRKPIPAWIKRTGLLLGSIAVSLLLAEGVLQIHQARFRAGQRLPVPEPGSIPLHVVCPEPFLYRLNPEHPDVSSQGVRDRKYVLPKPVDVFRILVLGDSVVYGSGIPQAELFTELLEMAGVPPADCRVLEVVNAGVKGYTTYNEIEYYAAEGRRFGADLVLLCVCLNDIVNPRTHWNYARDKITNIPDAAIPNLGHDRRFSRPFMAGREHWSAIVRSVAWRRYNLGLARANQTVVDGRSWPVYLAEDTTAIDRWLADTPEWRWFADGLRRLKRTVESDGARLAIVAFPLAYQLEPGYPFHPGARIAEFARQNGIPALDLEPALAAKEKDRGPLFLTAQNDVWHLSPVGHRVVADELADFLRENGWLESPAANAEQAKGSGDVW